MTSAPEGTKKLFVLDTNVLMHDPSALFRFQEHDVFIPMIVLEELDHSKKGLSEVARNARQASRFLDELIQHADLDAIHQGIELPSTQYAERLDERCQGRLYFQVERLPSLLPDTLPGQIPDNSILATALALSKARAEGQTIVVSKDINLRIKASVIGLYAEDYYNDQVLDDVDLLYSGSCELPLDFWATHGGRMTSWQEHGRTFYTVEGPLVKDWFPNQFLYLPDESQFEALVRKKDNNQAVIELARDFRTPQHAVWGVQARNREQNFALNMLLDPEIDFVTLLGTAGTGKTLLALAAGLTLTLDHKLYKEIVMTRETIPLGEDIGFLPGSEEEKMTPWMGALLDNLELLGSRENGGAWERGATNQLLLNRVKVRSLNFMRGRTFLSRYLILDEAQNLTSKQMKALVTRAGPGTKIVCLGNIGQIDTPYLTGTTSGLTYVVDRFKDWPHSAHITLKRGERSRLADFATETL
ncbi:PhoH family protein [Methylotetracoccus oryzae]|uniref:PhoH family protein n=1 Tax=Methylotetracoccus oryzae TaxID=1919059 RepID=UPI001119BF2A|nr:PhoH family protein [Methylotetracoccus oryzae]